MQFTTAIAIAVLSALSLVQAIPSNGLPASLLQQRDDSSCTDITGGATYCSYSGCVKTDGYPYCSDGTNKDAAVRPPPQYSTCLIPPRRANADLMLFRCIDRLPRPRRRICGRLLQWKGLLVWGAVVRLQCKFLLFSNRFLGNVVLMGHAGLIAPWYYLYMSLLCQLVYNRLEDLFLGWA